METGQLSPIVTWLLHVDIVINQHGGLGFDELNKPFNVHNIFYLVYISYINQEQDWDDSADENFKRYFNENIT